MSDCERLGVEDRDSDAPETDPAPLGRTCDGPDVPPQAERPDLTAFLLEDSADSGIPELPPVLTEPGAPGLEVSLRPIHGKSKRE